MRGRRPLALLGLVVLAGALLRVAGVGQNLFGDELFAYFEVHGRSLAGVFDQLRAPPVAFPTEVSPPLFFVLARAADALGDPVALRVPSLVAGTGTIAVVWALGRRVTGEGAGLVGAAVLALSPYAIFYSQDAVLLVTPEAADSPLGRSLAIYFTRPHPYATSAAPEAAWAAIGRGRRVFLVYPAVGILARIAPGTVLADHPHAMARTVRVLPDRVPAAVAVFAPR